MTRWRTRWLLPAVAAGVLLLVPAGAALAQPSVTAATSCSPDGTASYRLTVTGSEFPPQTTVTVSFTAAGGVVDPGGPRARTTTSDAAGAAVPVTLSPTTGVPGTVVQVAGTGFEPGARLLLRWDHGIGQVTVTVAGDGSFQAALLIFRKDIIGPRHLLVEPAGQALAGSTTSTTQAQATTATNLLDGAAAADATTFLVLPTRQNPALGSPATQGR